MLRVYHCCAVGAVDFVWRRADAADGSHDDVARWTKPVDYLRLLAAWCLLIGPQGSRPLDADLTFWQSCPASGAAVLEAVEWRTRKLRGATRN